MNQIAVKEQFKWLAKLGYAARGTIYFVIGTLAVMAAFSGGEGKTTDSKGAILTILDQPFGNVLLVILILGLLGYTSWRGTQAIFDTDDHGTDIKGIVIRGALIVSAISHLALAVWAISILLGNGSSGSGSSGQGWLSSGYSQVILSIAGVCAIGAGIAHIIKGWKAKFDRYMQIPENTHQYTRPLCRFGLISRGIVWCIIGWFLIRSALMARGNEISGIAEALQSLVNNTFGPWLLGIVAAGLVAFGIYSFLEAIYRRIDVQKAF